jgi:uncharacterized protein
LLMERSGKQVSLNKIGNILQISADTARRYFNFFTECYLIYPLTRFGTTNERLLSPKKIYACDLGVKHLFIGKRDIGSYFENYVYLQLRPYHRLFYLQKEGYEIDFITESSILIETKFNETMKGGQKELFEQFPAKKKVLIENVNGLKQLDEIKYQ